MRLIKRILYVILFCLPAFACSTSESKDVQFLISALSLSNSDDQVILSIPVNGCSGCAQESITFSGDHVDYNNFYTVLIGDDIKEAMYYKKEYFPDWENVLTLDSKEALANEIDIRFPSYYFISKSGTEKTVINAQTLQQSLFRIKEKLE